MTAATLFASLLLAQAPAPSASPDPAPREKAEKAAAVPAAPSDPSVQAAVAKMQGFYEGIQDFEARFDQTYTYKSFGRSQKSSGRMLFKKPGLMRWDYEKPAPKVFVVAGEKVYVHDPEAQTLTVAPMSTDKLSTSITFLWGKGRLADEFEIRRAERKDLGGGIALELTPKRPDPRFAKIFFLIDSASHAVKESIVVDPDGSENRMAFSKVKVNPSLQPSDFKPEVPEGTQVISLGQ